MRERDRETEREIDCYTSKPAPDQSKKGLAAWEKLWSSTCERALNVDGKLSYCMLLYCTVLYYTMICYPVILFAIHKYIYKHIYINI